MGTNVFLAPSPILQFLNNAGQPNAGGSVLTQVGGVDYPTYQDAAGTIMLPNPIPLNSRGEVSNTSGISCQLFLAAGVTYVFTQYDANLNQINQASWVGSSAILSTDYSSGNINRVVSSIAGLRALNHLSYATAFVTGYYGAHDGGGGAYQYDASDTTSADNGGTIIVANDGGRWKLQLITPVSVKQFGAYGDGTHDDTTALNACLSGMGVGQTIIFPSLTYLISGTLNGQSGQQLLADNANQAIIERTTDFGDTLYFASAGAARVNGLWFQQTPFYTAGQTSLTNPVTSGAHVHMVNAQEARIENCYMWRMKYGIILDGCTLTTVRNNWIQGVWDEQNAGCQEGIANIWLNNAARNCEIIKIVDNYLTGAKSAARPLTWTSGDGSTTATVTENIGSQYGILIYGCEDLLIHENFIGANQASGIQGNLVNGSVNLDWRISENFFDDGPTHGQSINITSPSNVYVNGVTITGNVFNGELVGFQAIQEYSAGTSGASPAMVNFAITGNTFQAHIGTPINIYGAVNGVISGNNITGYNCRATSAGADSTYCAAVNLAGSSQYIHVHGNNCGGAVGSGGPFGANTHLAIANGGTNAGLNSVHDNLFIAGGTSDNQVGPKEYEQTFLTSTTNYQATSTDRICIMAMVRTAAWSFGLPLNPTPGRTVTLKDGAGQAGTYGVQVVGVVDGVTNPNYTTNYFSKTFQWNNVSSQWNVIYN